MEARRLMVVQFITYTVLIGESDFVSELNMYSICYFMVISDCKISTAVSELSREWRAVLIKLTASSRYLERSAETESIVGFTREPPDVSFLCPLYYITLYLLGSHATITIKYSLILPY